MEREREAGGEREDGRKEARKAGVVRGRAGGGGEA